MTDEEAQAIARRLTPKQRDAVMGRESGDERTLHLHVTHANWSRVFLILDGIPTNDGLCVRAALVEMEAQHDAG